MSKLWILLLDLHGICQYFFFLAFKIRGLASNYPGDQTLCPCMHCYSSSSFPLSWKIIWHVPNISFHQVKSWFFLYISLEHKNNLCCVRDHQHIFSSFYLYIHISMFASIFWCCLCREMNVSLSQQEAHELSLHIYNTELAEDLHIYTFNEYEL